MTRKTRGQQAEQIIQDDPTAPRARTPHGLELDEWGLPLSGPIRAQWLRDMGKPDPNIDPDAWATPAPEAASDAALGDAETATETEMNDG